LTNKECATEDTESIIFEFKRIGTARSLIGTTNQSVMGI